MTFVFVFRPKTKNLLLVGKLLRSPQFITMIIQCWDHHLTHSSLQ